MVINSVNVLSPKVRTNLLVSKSSSASVSVPNNRNVNENIPASVYRANFSPSFGKYKKVKNVTLYNKNTNMPVKASLLKDSFESFIAYKIVIDREEAGFLHMDVNSIFPEKRFLSTEPDNNIPEIRHIRSLKGDRYYGIGTELINAAIDESYDQGKNGSLWLNSEQGYAYSLSKYRQYENPIPFYYKMGFRCLDKSVDNLIKKSLEIGKYNFLPEEALLILSSDNARKFKEKHDEGGQISIDIA